MRRSDRALAQAPPFTARPGTTADGPARGGATVLGDAPACASPATGPEVYVVALVAARWPEARGVGRFLLAEAGRVATERQVPVLRLDCYDGDLLIGEWVGQVLQRTIRPAVV